MNAQSLRRASIHPLRAISAARFLLWTTWNGIDLRIEGNDQTGVSEDVGTCHVNSGGPDLRAAIRHFRIKERSVFDIGCGKGGALIEFHRLGFRRLSGIELSERLLRVCRRNLAALDIEANVIHGNAAEFRGFAPFDLVYMYNALSASHLDLMLANLCASPGVKKVMFRNPLHWDIMERYPLRHRGDFIRNDRYSLFDLA